MDGRHGRQGRHFLVFLLATLLLNKIPAQRIDSLTANLSTLRTNGPNIDHIISNDKDYSMIKVLLLRQSLGFYGPCFGCGFFCRNDSSSGTTTTTPCSSFLFAIFVASTNSSGCITMSTLGTPQVVWSANRNRPISENATLQLTRDDNLIFKDVVGSLVWSSKVVLWKAVSHYNSRAFIKVQAFQASSDPNYSSVYSGSKTIPVATVAGAIHGDFLGLFLIIGMVVVFLKRRNKIEEEEDDDLFDQLPGMPTRFLFDRKRVCFLFGFFYMVTLLQATPDDYPTANLSTNWTNGPNINHTIKFFDGTTIKALLLRQSPHRNGIGPAFACGFFCSSSSTTSCDSFLFAIFVVYTNSGARITEVKTGTPQVVWSANRNKLVRENATLQLTGDGDLVLKDVDGSLVWSTKTSGKSVAWMNLTESGNLVLVGKDNEAVWQSFDHPTDTLVLRQTLVEGQRITANTSASNWTEGQLFLSATSGGWAAFAGSESPQLYYKYNSSIITKGNKPAYVKYVNGSLNFFINSSDPSIPYSSIDLPSTSYIQFLRLEFDGQLRVYQWINGSRGWRSVLDLIDDNRGVCDYPTVCGQYGICFNGDCSCPQGDNGDNSYFTQVDYTQPYPGCSMTTPLSCRPSFNHSFLSLRDVSYFTFERIPSVELSNHTTEESCRNACLGDCSCKAAMFRYLGNVSDGWCYLPSQVFSLMSIQPKITHYNSTAFIKVQVSQASSPTQQVSPNSSKKSVHTGVIIGSIVGSLIGMFLIVVIIVTLIRTRKEKKEEEELYLLERLPGVPTKFSFEELRAATNNFSKELGQGGFGSVYEGTLVDGIKIAVKRLKSIAHGTEDFLAEVQIIGSIHHVNLVKLIGYCVEQTNKFLVYEYMSNGSLDKWIFQRDQNHVVNWQTRSKIINHVAKGLLYLHEECSQKIAHLDIKPQNILLDDYFNAKVADFGLSKLIDNDQSCAMTRLRGTPGYMAPEWLTLKITEKVDVYSFGVVVVEIVCMRRNLKHPQNEDSVPLLSLLMDMASKDQILNFIEEYSETKEIDENEAIRMLRLAIWCVQSDAKKRPSMSTILKVLEDSLEVENFDNDHLDLMNKAEVAHPRSSTQQESILSGPR